MTLPTKDASQSAPTFPGMRPPHSSIARLPPRIAPIPIGKGMGDVQLDEPPATQPLLDGGQATPEMPAVTRVLLVEIMMLVTQHDQIRMHHLVDQRRPHVAQPGGRQLHVGPIQDDADARTAGGPRARGGGHAGDGARTVAPAQVHVVVEAPREEDGVDVVEGFEDDVFAVALCVLELCEAVQGGRFGGAARLRVEAFELAGCAAEGQVRFRGGRPGARLQDVELLLADGVGGAAGGEDGLCFGGWFWFWFGGEGEAHGWLG